MKLILWVEGATDANEHEERGAEGATDASVGKKRSVEGALLPLLRKLLANAPRMTPEIIGRMFPDDEIEVVTLKEHLKKFVRLSGGGNSSAMGTRVWKLLAAFDKERSKSEPPMVIAVWDSDGRTGARGPLQDRDEVREHLQNRQWKGVAVGVCIHEMEAWLLDDDTLKRCFGKGPREGTSDRPETVRDPKKVLTAQLEHYETGDRVAATYTKLANAVDVERLAQRCPLGFGKFAQDVATFLYPVFAGGAKSRRG